MTKIRVNKNNSKLVDGKLFISLSKSDNIKNQLLMENINDKSSIVHPTIGRMVSYEGEYIRVIK
jgi:hypothetical protein|tara:strand:+ start:313 stop:504 length:192 start_codon:yes stop_codon:yes gene_type:complete